MSAVCPFCQTTTVVSPVSSVPSDVVGAASHTTHGEDHIIQCQHTVMHTSRDDFTGDSIGIKVIGLEQRPTCRAVGDGSQRWLLCQVGPGWDGPKGYRWISQIGFTKVVASWMASVGILGSLLHLKKPEPSLHRRDQSKKRRPSPEARDPVRSRPGGNIYVIQVASNR